jgi:2-oxoglutarate ferredoxin oxidoreductase subunit beta
MKTKSTPLRQCRKSHQSPSRWQSSGGATYVARAFSGKQKHLVDMIKGAIQHKGFALVDVFSPCVTYNKDNTYQFFNPRASKFSKKPVTTRPTSPKRWSGVIKWGEEIPIGLVLEAHGSSQP